MDKPMKIFRVIESSAADLARALAIKLGHKVYITRAMGGYHVTDETPWADDQLAVAYPEGVLIPLSQSWKLPEQHTFSTDIEFVLHGWGA